MLLGKKKTGLSPFKKGWQTTLPAELLGSSELLRIARKVSLVCTREKNNVLMMKVKVKGTKTKKK